MAYPMVPARVTEPLTKRTNENIANPAQVRLRIRDSDEVIAWSLWPSPAVQLAASANRADI